MHFLTWPILVIVFKFFVKFQAGGVENIKNIKGPVIFISNHESYFDPYIIGMGIPWFSRLSPVRYMANDDLFKKKILKFCLWLYGAFPGEAGKEINNIIEKPVKFLKNRETVGIFPEWCYENELELSRLRRAIVLLAVQNMVPIIPVFIYGIYDGGISWNKILRKQRYIKLIFGKPLYLKKKIPEEKGEELVERARLEVKLSLIKFFHKKEKEFWNNYSKFYHFLERAEPYKELMDDFNKNLPDIITGKWIDLGSGSGAIIDLLNKKPKGVEGNIDITATDIEFNMLNFISKRFNNSIKTKEMDLALNFNIPDNSFDGVTANLVLPYLIHHNGVIGLNGFIALLKSVFNILKPGGVFVWSAPKNKVNFLIVFLSSWRNIFDFKNPQHIYYGPSILKQALKIQKKGECGIYHFLTTDELEKILTDIGFINIKFSLSMARQVNIISCKKPDK